MRQKLLLFLRLTSVSIRSELTHRASFIMLTCSYFLSAFVDIVAIWVLFDRFNIVKGWTMEELVIIYGIMQMGFSLAEGFARGFDQFHLLVKRGDFDRVLLRPQSALLQISTMDVQPMRIGRFVQGLIVLLWGMHALSLSILSLQGIIIAVSVFGAMSLFYGLFILQATLSFWTIESLEVMNIVTYGGLQTGQYPMSIYDKGFRLFFTFVIPLATVSYYPVFTMLKSEELPLWIALFFPLCGPLFCFVATQFFHFGVRRYCSTGS